MLWWVRHRFRLALRCSRQSSPFFARGFAPIGGGVTSG